MDDWACNLAVRCFSKISVAELFDPRMKNKNKRYKRRERVVSNIEWLGKKKTE